MRKQCAPGPLLSSVGPGNEARPLFAFELDLALIKPARYTKMIMQKYNLSLTLGKLCRLPEAILHEAAKTVFFLCVCVCV